MAASSRKEQEELQPVIQETVVQRLGFPEKAVIKAAMSCLAEDLDHDGSVGKMSALLGDELASRFVEDLNRNVDNFRRDKRNRKRAADSDSQSEKKSKLGRLDALVDDEPLPPPIPEVQDPLAELTSASNITAMVANMKKQIEERKRALLQSGLGNALMMQGQRFKNEQEQEEIAEKKFLEQASEKQRRAAELQARIKDKMAGKAGLLLSMKDLPIKAPEENVIHISAIQQPTSVIVDSEGVAVDKTTGRQIQITQRMPTLKVNIREKKREMLKLEGVKPEEVTTESTHFDDRIGMGPAQRQRRNFKFHEAGKFQQLASRMRAKAQLEKLQKQIQETAKKTGITSAAKLAKVMKADELDSKVIPDIEWWDKAILPNNRYEVIYGTSSDKYVGITNLVEHPLQKELPSEPKSVPALPVFLTKKERKKIRNQKRREQEKEKQEKIRLGLEPPPPPKVKISNLMRVLATEAVQDPTKVEAHVRAQMAARQRAHEAANEERKLTKEQRSAKKVKKLKEDLSTGVHVSVFCLLDISNPAKKFKVDQNAQQLYLTGMVAITKERVLVITEGGPKSQKKWKHLMLNRIKWSEDSAQGHKQDKIDKKNNEENAERKMNECRLIWEGTNIKRKFTDWKFQTFTSDLLARQQLKEFSCEHYWDLANNQAVLEEVES